MLALDSTLVDLLCGAWPNQWRTTEIELLYTRLAASAKFRTAVEYDLHLRGEAEAVLAKAKYVWPGPPAGRRTRRRRSLAATVAATLCILIGWQLFIRAREAGIEAARRDQSVNNKSAAKELADAVARSSKHASPKRIPPATATKTQSAPPTKPQVAPQPEAKTIIQVSAEQPEPTVPAAKNEAPPFVSEPPPRVAELPFEPFNRPAIEEKLNRGRGKGIVRHAPEIRERPKREHPLELDASREAQTLALEIAGAMAEKQWSDLHRSLETMTPGSLGSLVPAFDDEGLWVSYSTLVDSLVSHQAGLRSLLQTQLEPLARLRLAAALESSNEERVAAVAWHFYGTDASAQAHLWLADRALSMGNFATARAHYERAKVYASNNTRNELASHLRLAGAMLGTPLGKPIKTPVQLSGSKFSPIDFEAMVMTQQLTHQRRHVSPAMIGADTPAPHVPSANKNQQPFLLTNWLEYDDLSSARRAGSPPSDDEHPCHELFSLPVGDVTILGNALSVSAIETRTAKVRWEKDLTSARERHGLRALGPVMPAVADGRIYVRRWTREGTELLCLNLTSGDVLWQTELTPEEQNRTLRGIMLTDPQIDGQRLTMITATPAADVSLRVRPETEDILWEVRLAEFSRQNGSLLREQTLARLTGLTHVPRASRVMLAGRWRVVQVAGTVICLDATGELAWIRRVPWQETEQFDASYRCAAVTDGNLVCVWQPGATTVECLELANGKQHWQAPASQVTRLVGVQENRLITLTSEGLEAIDLKDGRPAWSRKLSWAARQAVICGSPGGLMFAEAQQTPTGSWEGKLFWLDAATGANKSSASLNGDLQASKRPTQPLIGPLTPHGKGLLAGYDSGQRGGQRRELLWITPPE
jgi:outer membrane protein assembly factor BamB